MAVAARSPRSRMPLPPASPPPPIEFEVPSFPSDDQYERICQIGQGTFGVVYKAKAPDQSMVALKALRLEDQQHGFSVTSVREIQILQRLSHENVISICDVVASKDAHSDRANAHVYVVFPYLDHDLAGLLDNPTCRITPPITKTYFAQIATAVSYLHGAGVLHRDLKCSNILIGDDGIVKLADFGLARPVRHDNQPYTDKVCTLWYRAPELLLGDRHYGPPLDIWSLGCVFAEMLTGRPLFHGSTEMDQLDSIFKLCGTPTTLPSSTNPTPARQYPRQIRKVFSKYGTQEADLLDRMLQVEPSKRITADQVLQHAYFRTSPLPLQPAQIPKFAPSNELSAARRKGLSRPAPGAKPGASWTGSPTRSSGQAASKRAAPPSSADRAGPFKRPRSVSPRRHSSRGTDSDSRSHSARSRTSNRDSRHHDHHHHPASSSSSSHHYHRRSSTGSNSSGHHRNGDGRDRR